MLVGAEEREEMHLNPRTAMVQTDNMQKLALTK
jgi:hypothetical protein